MTPTPSASIFYGVHVRLSDLLAAGDAFKQVRPALTALDLIKHRRDHGTLCVAPPSSQAIAQVPEEVWDLVAGFLVRPAVWRACLDLLKRLHCRSCEIDRREDMGRSLVEQLQAEYQAKGVWQTDWIDGGYEGGCDHGRPQLLEQVGLWEEKLTKRSPVVALLRRYGLHLPAPAALPHPHAPALSAALTPIALLPPTASAVSLPPDRHHHRRSRHACDSSSSDSDSDPRPARFVLRTGQLDLDRLRVPAGADARFIRLCREYAVGSVVVDAGGRATGGRATPAFYLCNAASLG